MLAPTRPSRVVPDLERPSGQIPDFQDLKIAVPRISESSGVFLSLGVVKCRTESVAAISDRLLGGRCFKSFALY